MESRDLVSVSRPILRVSVLVSKDSGLVSVSKVSGLETLNIAKKCFIKIFIIQTFMFVVFSGKKQPKHVGKRKNARNLKKFKSEAWASAETFPGEQTRYFAYPFHVADDTMQMHVHKTLCPFYTITKMLPATQGCNEGARGEQFAGLQITMGAPNHCEGRHKVPTISQYFLQYITFASERSQVRTWGRQTCFFPGAPSNLVTPLLLHQQSQKSPFVGAAMLLFHFFFSSHCTVQNCEAYHLPLLAVTVSQHFLRMMSAFNSHMRQTAYDGN